MAPFPLIKLVALVVKQIAKPLSKVIQERAFNSQFFKNYVVVPSAQIYHRFDISIRMRLLGFGNPDKVQPLTEKQAVELGAELLGEFFVFSAAAGAIVLEYLRQSSNKAAKFVEVAYKIDLLDSTSEDLSKSVEENTKALNEIKKLMEDYKKDYDAMKKRIVELEKIAEKTNFLPRASNLNDPKDVRNSNVYQGALNAVYSITHRNIDK